MFTALINDTVNLTDVPILQLPKCHHITPQISTQSRFHHIHHPPEIPTEHPRLLPPPADNKSAPLLPGPKPSAFLRSPPHPLLVRQRYITFAFQHGRRKTPLPQDRFAASLKDESMKEATVLAALLLLQVAVDFGPRHLREIW